MLKRRALSRVAASLQLLGLCSFFPRLFAFHIKYNARRQGLSGIRNYLQNQLRASVDRAFRRCSPWLTVFSVKRCWACWILLFDFEARIHRAFTIFYHASLFKPCVSIVTLIFRAALPYKFLLLASRFVASLAHASLSHHRARNDWYEQPPHQLEAFTNVAFLHSEPFREARQSC